jgi:hypothetical protein
MCVRHRHMRACQIDRSGVRTVIWRNRRTAVADPGEDLLVSTPETADRLRRIVARQEARNDARVNADAMGDATSAGVSITLKNNAFATLGIALDASSERISQAFDDLSFEPGQDPAALDAARARLLSARDRLAEEMGWLPECSADAQTGVQAAIRAGDAATLARVRDSADGLARLNLSVALTAASPTDLQGTLSILADAQTWNVDTTLDRIDEARLRSGFKPVDPEQWDHAVEDRLGEIATALAPCFADSQDGRTALATAMLRSSARGGGHGTIFLEKVAAAHAANIDRKLEQLNARIMDYVDRLRARPGDQAIATTLLSSLDMWSQLRRPIQILEAARGLDDPSSATLLRCIRELAVYLTNEHSQFEIALRLARAMVTCFSQVPNLKQEIEREMPILITNALFARLRSICDLVLAHHRVFAQQLPHAGMSPEAPGLIGQLVQAFEECCRSSNPQVAGPWVVLRGLAIDLHNKHRHSEVTRIIMNWMISEVPPQDVLDKLREDVRILQPRPR